LAAGTPVIAYKAGGALDYIEPGNNGLFFNEQTVESLAEVLRKFSADKFDRSQIQAAASQFSVQSFHAKMTRFVNSYTSKGGHES
jgi:glycosyltransferase involved in cell wall biosynthesis